MKPKATFTAILGLLAVVFLSGNANACCGGCSMHGSVHHGSWGRGYSNHPNSSIDSAAQAKFQEETLKIRKDVRRLELEIEKEYLEDTPDTKRIAQLKKRAIDLHAELEKLADKHGIVEHHSSWCWMDHGYWW